MVWSLRRTNFLPAYVPASKLKLSANAARAHSDCYTYAHDRILSLLPPCRSTQSFVFRPRLNVLSLLTMQETRFLSGTHHVLTHRAGCCPFSASRAFVVARRWTRCHSVPVLMRPCCCCFFPPRRYPLRLPEQACSYNLKSQPSCS